MTETEAKDKRCCGPEGTGAYLTSGVRWCIGSACMAWQWSDTNNKYGDFEDQGYCGLAKK